MACSVKWKITDKAIKTKSARNTFSDFISKSKVQLSARSFSKYFFRKSSTDVFQSILQEFFKKFFCGFHKIKEEIQEYPQEFF